MALRTHRCEPGETCSCAECEQPIIRKGWRDDVTGQVFCSPMCSVNYRNAMPRAAHQPRGNPHGAGGHDAVREQLVAQARARRLGKHQRA